MERVSMSLGAVPGGRCLRHQRFRVEEASNLSRMMGNAGSVPHAPPAVWRQSSFPARSMTGVPWVSSAEYVAPGCRACLVSAPRCRRCGARAEVDVAAGVGRRWRSGARGSHGRAYGCSVQFKQSDRHAKPWINWRKHRKPKYAPQPSALLAAPGAFSSTKHPHCARLRIPHRGLMVSPCGRRRTQESRRVLRYRQLPLPSRAIRCQGGDHQAGTIPWRPAM